jgi:hypothetical protein
LANGRRQPAGVTHTTTGSAEPLIYRIDAANRITWVNPAWVDFALANDGEASLPEKVIGSDLLATLSDGTIQALYLTMIQRARAGGVVRFTYRCDAPDRRRTFTMEIQSRPGDEVEFRSTLVREELRPTIGLLQVSRQRDRERFVRVCSWCQRIALPDGRWVEVEEAVVALDLFGADHLPLLTHGICRPCCEEMERMLGLPAEPGGAAK